MVHTKKIWEKPTLIYVYLFCIIYWTVFTLFGKKADFLWTEINRLKYMYTEKIFF